MSLPIDIYQKNQVNFSIIDQPKEKKSPDSFFMKINFHELDTSYIQFHKRVVKKLDDWDTVLDKWIPPLEIQNSYDLMIKKISQELSSPNTNWDKFNTWLDDSGQSHWFSQLATFLAKLPLKSARNILRLMGNIIKMAVLTSTEIVIHPMKAIVKIVKLLVELVNALIKPETWTRLGVGLVGSSLATLTATSNPLAVVSTGIGASLGIIGISAGTLKTILVAQKDKRFSNLQDYLIEQAKTVSEDLLTSYCLGLLLLATQRIVRCCQEMYYDKLNKCALDQLNSQNQNIIDSSKNIYTDQQQNVFLKKHGLPKAEIYIKKNLNFNVRWRMDRVKYGDLVLKELPEGNLVIENIQTNTLVTKTDVWIEGYYKTESVKYQVFDQATSTTKTIIEPLAKYVPGYWDVAVTKTPIYESFFGYNVSLKCWQQPPLQSFPSPIAVPDPILTLDARLATPAQTVNDFCDKAF
ncbi:MAG: hypothetical protein H0X29_06325 [Parachlamydiaceae bacterium]|nr:hypothetical protein [Parachlamydiaceae bacterium]